VGFGFLGQMFVLPRYVDQLVSNGGHGSFLR
jgi:hypothetical protein